MEEEVEGALRSLGRDEAGWKDDIGRSGLLVPLLLDMEMRDSGRRKDAMRCDANKRRLVGNTVIKLTYASKYESNNMSARLP